MIQVGAEGDISLSPPRFFYRLREMGANDRKPASQTRFPAEAISAKEAANVD